MRPKPHLPLADQGTPTTSYTMGMYCRSVVTKAQEPIKEGHHVNTDRSVQFVCPTSVR